MAKTMTSQGEIAAIKLGPIEARQVTLSGDTKIDNAIQERPTDAMPRPALRRVGRVRRITSKGKATVVKNAPKPSKTDSSR